jgi:hypothetical protein
VLLDLHWRWWRSRGDSGQEPVRVACRGSRSRHRAPAVTWGERAALHTHILVQLIAQKIGGQGPAALPGYLPKAPSTHRVVKTPWPARKREITGSRPS